MDDIIKPVFLIYGNQQCKKVYMNHHYSTDFEDMWTIVPEGDLGVCIVRGDKTKKDGTFPHKIRSLSESYLKEIPGLEKIQDKSFNSPQDLLRAFGDIVNSHSS